jgi:hypothetical protein
MKKVAKKKPAPDMLDEYDFSKGVRGKYAKRYAEGTNVVVLAPDVAEFFPDAETVNAALRALVGVARKSVKRPAVSAKQRSRVLYEHHPCRRVARMRLEWCSQSAQRLQLEIVVRRFSFSLSQRVPLTKYTTVAT